MLQDHQLTILTSARYFVPATALSCATTVANRRVEVESSIIPMCASGERVEGGKNLLQKPADVLLPCETFHQNELTLVLSSWCKLGGGELDQSRADLPTLSRTADRGQYR